jgi:hypothetical protein
MAKSSKSQPCVTGTHRGEFYRLARINEIFPACRVRSAWWFLDDGNHFRTLTDLRRFVDERKRQAALRS